MKRTQMQLDEPTYEALRKLAFDQGTSMAEIIRRAINQYLGKGLDKPFNFDEIAFIGIGRSEPSELDPISERHDEALAEDMAK